MRPLLGDPVARRAQAVIPPPFGAEIPGAVPVVTSFTFGLVDPRLFPKADLGRGIAEVLMTCNTTERLDPAVLRKGRVDFVQELTHRFI